MTGDGFVGVRVVARRGDVVDVRTGGFADIQAEMRWSVSTRTQIASISKQFAAVVALVLADRGVVGLDDPIARLMPVPQHWSDVTLGQLLTHTSGMRHWDDLPGFDPATPQPPDEQLAALLDAPLLDPPGARWRYSSPGYVVAAAALSSAAARDYAELVRQIVVDRLGLTHTTVGVALSAGDARGYRDGAPVPTWELHAMPGTGDVVSSATDVLRFVNALHTGELLPMAAQQLMHTTRVELPASSRSTGLIHTRQYGLGYFVGEVNTRTALLHPGDNPGYQSLAAWLPEMQTTVVTLTNDEAIDLEAALADAG